MSRCFRTGCALAIVAVVHPAWAARAATCESLAWLSQPRVVVTSAQTVAAGQFAPPATRGRGGSNAFAALPAFCQVAATLTPSSDSDIKIEVWLPVAGWNGKLEAVGNGAWAGVISYPALATALAAGYAAVSTDTGHTGGNANFMVGHPEKLVDFEDRAVHVMTTAAKAVVSAYYGSAPKRAYFNGCSTGGRQALTAAQRFPDDFDAIVAGAPANFAKRQTFGQIWLWQATHKDEASFIPVQKYQVLHKAVLDACDGLDGVRDGVLEDPTRCKFDPKVVQCRGADGPDCLTAPQVEAARKIYAGASNPRTKEPIFPGLQPGSELGWGQSVGAQPVGYAADFFKYVVVKDEKWDPRTLNFDSDVALTEKVATGLNAVDADLTRFAARGGKLLIYHGWSDPGIPPQNTVNYYKSVLAGSADKKAVRDAVRAFMVPGMGHCGGGEGTGTFDLVTAVDHWIDTGIAPTQILASRVIDGSVVRTRPLCPYPRVASYKGTGSTDEAANFVCAAGPVAASSRPVAPPSIVGPISLTSSLRDSAHGYPFNASVMDLARRGYIEEEFFIQGAAHTYEVPRDQMSNAAPSEASHPYKTRLVVRRPESQARFNGTAIVEWTNVSEGFDNEVEWFHSGEHFVRAGYAWVGVSAQSVGVSVLKQWSPARYGTLDVTDGGTVTGDALSYDIFTAAALASRGKANASIMGTLNVERLIASGHSQSAGRLATYFNTVHPLAPVYDAVVLHGGGGRMRTDVSVKTWKLLSETDVLGQAATRQPDTDKFRTWEVAGTSHLDFKQATELVKLGLRSRETMLPNAPPPAGGGRAGRGRGGPGSSGTPGPFNGCNHPPLSRIPEEYVQNALYDHMARWLKDGTPPPTAPPVEIKTDDATGRPAIVRDAFGNALGGIRLAEHGVATATNSGENMGSGFCFLTGWHEDFDKSRLDALYSTHAAYVVAVRTETEKNIKAGYIVKADAQTTMTNADRARVGKP